MARRIVAHEALAMSVEIVKGLCALGFVSDLTIDVQDGRPVLCLRWVHNLATVQREARLARGRRWAKLVERRTHEVELHVGAVKQQTTRNRAQIEEMAEHVAARRLTASTV